MNNASASLRGRTVVVTGASRGIGRGLAVAFGEQHAHVIVSGRTPHALEETKQLVHDAGGTCDVYCVDHSDDDQQVKFFHRLVSDLQDNDRRLDIFVNNAYSAVPYIKEHARKATPFWERSSFPQNDDYPGAVWDQVNNVGLRSIYVSSILATRIMNKQQIPSGLIVTITSVGGVMPVFDPAYGIGKAALDRMYFEFSKSGPENISYVSFCPATVSTKEILELKSKQSQLNKAQSHMKDNPHKVPRLSIWNLETPLFVGRCLAAFSKDQELARKSNGSVVLCANIGERFQIVDENNFRPLSIASPRLLFLTLIPYLRTSPLRFLIPRTPVFPWAPLLRSFSGYIKYY